MLRTGGGWSRDGVLWAAGYFDGEGCLSGSRSKAHNQRYSESNIKWTMCISSTDLDMLQKFMSVFRCGKIYGPTTVPNNKPIWRWQVVSAPNIYAMCVAMFPFVCARRTERFRQFIEYFKAYRYNGGEKRRSRIVNCGGLHA